MKILPFAPNRVLRLYRGGSGIDRLCGIEPAVDNNFPENWIASCIEGNGRVYHSPGHGISKVMVDGKTVSFPEFLAAHAAEMLGEKHLRRYGAIPAVLVKLLDSAEELPLQVHPTRDDARRHLHADYGKTEAWIVLATHEVKGVDPYLLVGFNDSVNETVFTREARNGRFETALTMLNKLRVAPGDVIVIRGGLPHAIGPGVTMVEIMEPSDFVVIPERECCGVVLDEKQRFMGIAPETALAMFDFTPMTEEVLRRRCCPVARILAETPSGILRSLIAPSDCEYFSAVELTLDGTWDFDNSESFGIGIVVEGELDFDGITVGRGGNFFLPWCIKRLPVAGRGRLILVRPPAA